MFNYRFLFTIFLLFLIRFPYILGQSSNIGIPSINNFSKKDFTVSTQNWDIEQDERGVMYFANNHGLLEFDGNHWKCHQVSNKTIVRSLEIDNQGRIFVGAQGELGYFFSNEIGVLEYKSLKNLLAQEDQGFADIWGIEISENRVFFTTGNKVILYENDTLKVIYRSKNSLDHLSKVGNHLFIYDRDRGILKFTNNIFSPIITSPFLSKQQINRIFSFDDTTLLICTRNNSFFLYKNQQIIPWTINGYNTLTSDIINNVVAIDSSRFAFSTFTKGLFIIHKDGHIIRHLDRKSGLQVNNTISVYIDRSKNIWVGLDNGIDFIEMSSPFTYIFPDGDLQTSGYAVQIHNNKIYLGTSNGLYYSDWQTHYNPISNVNYTRIKNPRGQVWELSKVEDDLLLSHHEGLFEVNGDVTTKIDAPNGAWMQLLLAKNKMISGHYNGLIVLDKKNDTWQTVSNFQHNWRESCRILVQDNKGYIWISHPYRGVFRVSLNEDFSAITDIKTYNSQHGFPSDWQIYVFKIGDEIVFCGEKGIYSYNEAKDYFEPNDKWNTIFGKENRVSRLIEAPNGNIWFASDEGTGFLDVKDRGVYKEVDKKILPQLSGILVDAFEKIYPYDDENVFIAQESGFIHYNPKQPIQDTIFNTLINSVISLSNDSLLYGGNPIQKPLLPTIDYKNNALRFYFSTTYYGNIEANQFQYFLEGFDKKWSSWTSKSETEYTNLNAGTYTFQVKAKNINGNESNIARFEFKVLPPWYASTFAFIIYLLLIGGFLFFLIVIPQRKFEREKTALESKRKAELLEKEKAHEQIEQVRQQQISQLEKEKLELQILAQRKELASSTMHLVQKSEILQKIKDEIQKIAKSSNDETITKQLQKVIRKVIADERLDDDWEQFAKHFDQVHQDFLERIRVQYPQLTPKDHRLCAYLRMNLVSKEIAPLMNISVRSVEVARYRLRKKLNLDNNVNLVDFMMSI